MQKMVLVGMSFMVIVMVNGCTVRDAIDEAPPASTGDIEITNSSSSTYRIVSATANIPDKSPQTLNISGNGIHKGEMQYFVVRPCEKQWIVDVIYNDPAHTNCEKVHTVPCGSSANFTFNNTVSPCL